MNTFKKKKIKNVDFGLQNASFTPLWAKQRFSLKLKAVTLNHVLMPIIRSSFRNIEKTDLKKSSKGVNFGIKNDPVPSFWAKEFLLKSQNCQFYTYFNVC